MFDANIPRKMWRVLLSEVFQNAKKFDGLALHEFNGLVKLGVDHWTVVLPDFIKHLWAWEEADTEKGTNKNSPKMINKEVNYMIVEYPEKSIYNTFHSI